MSELDSYQDSLPITWDLGTGPGWDVKLVAEIELKSSLGDSVHLSLKEAAELCWSPLIQHIIFLLDENNYKPLVQLCQKEGDPHGYKPRQSTLLGHPVYVRRSMLGVPISSYSIVYFQICPFERRVIVEGSNLARMFEYSAKFTTCELRTLIQKDLPNFLQHRKIRSLVQRNNFGLVSFLHPQHGTFNPFSYLYFQPVITQSEYQKEGN